MTTDTGPARFLVLSGGGVYRDPWHPFGATSARLAGVLTGAGFELEVREDVAAAVSDLSGWDAIVVNAASGPEDDPLSGPDGPAAAGLAAALGRGLGVLAVHVGVGTLLRLPGWEAVTGAAWIAGQSGHPKTGPCTITTYPGRHPVIGDQDSFPIVDERYSFLRLAPGLVPLADHEWEGSRHPLIWARELPSGSRVVADALGHDERSYDSPAHRDLIVRAARWLTRAR